MSLNSSLQTLGQLMATNLQSKGVTANASDGLTTLANKILQVESTPIGYNLKLTSDKNILSFYDNEYCVLTATLLDSNGNGVSGEEIVFKANGGVLGTVITGDNGVAQYTYQSTGVGDVSLTASVGSLVSEIYVVEDCIYYNSSEVTRTTTNGSTIYDNNMSVALPSNCEISFDFWSDNTNPTGEHRFFLLPKSQFSTGTTQPEYGLFADQKGENIGSLGKRENNSTVASYANFSVTCSTWHTVKWVKNSTSVDFYMDTTLKGNQTLSWLDSYSDWCFSMIRWTSKGTSTMKNVKIKAV